MQNESHKTVVAKGDYSMKTSEFTGDIVGS